MLNRISTFWYGEESPPPPPRGTSVTSLLANFQVPSSSCESSPGESIRQGENTGRVGQAGTAPATGAASGSSVLGSGSKGALQFREPTVTGSAVVKTIDPGTLGENPWSDWSEENPEDVASDIPGEPIPPRQHETLIISRVFGITVSTEEIHHTAGQPEYLVMLLETAADCSSLTLDNLDQALFERVSMTAPELKECLIKMGDVRFMHASKISLYLLECAGRAAGELRGNVGREEMRVLEGCRSAAVRMLGVVLVSHDNWAPQQPALQLAELILPTDSSLDMLNATLYPSEVLSEILEGEMLPAEDKVVVVTPILGVLLKKARFADLNNAHFTVNLLRKLNEIICNKEFANIVPSLPGWLPANMDSGAAYQNTLLGKFLGCSTIRANVVVGQPYTSPYFNRAAFGNVDVAQHSAVQYQQMIDNIQSLTSKFLYLLLTSEAKQATLRWIGGCLDANRNKGKLMASFVNANSSASDGFMLNLAAVLIKLCAPFISPRNPRLSSIDARFCAPDSGSVLPQGGQDMILEKIDGVEITRDDLLMLGTPAQFSFITTCFFVTHRALQLAYTAPFDKYRRLMKSLMETQRLLQDLAGGGMGEVRERFETLFTEQLEVKTHLLHPDTISQVLLFYSSSASWLSHISTHHDTVTVGDMEAQLALPTTPSKTLAALPSYMLSASCQFFINVRYFAEVSLENFSTENLDFVVTFLVLFSNEHWVPNPHTRAEIVEALTVFIPNERAKSSVPTSNREATLRGNALARDRLGAALIALFVDIEQGAEFHHKFQYRFHIFELLQYLWPVPEFRLSNLSVEVRGREEDTTLLFTRFLKLLLNDANFLLDEALRNLSEIKKIEMLQDNSEEWGKLDDSARQGKLGSLAELKRMCTSHNILASETVNCLRYMTQRHEGMSEDSHTNVTYSLVTPLLVDTLVQMLNYYLKELVSESQIKYKVRNFDEVKFYPGKLLRSIAGVYLNLRCEGAFVSAIPRDGRSYHVHLFKDTASKLRKLMVDDSTVEQLLEVGNAAELELGWQVDEETLSDLAPSQYLDPILGTLMKDPVLLPTSNVILDRSVIGKHLLSDPIDPFNRQPLAMKDVILQEDLRREIKLWKEEQLLIIRSAKGGAT